LSITEVLFVITKALKWRKDMAKRSFDEWKKLVNEWLLIMVGMTADDLPDIDYYNMWSDGVSPKNAASKAKKNAFE
jgi:hypothetical protein